jgi:hypothetical protein
MANTPTPAAMGHIERRILRIDVFVIFMFVRSNGLFYSPRCNESQRSFSV